MRTLRTGTVLTNGTGDVLTVTDIVVTSWVDISENHIVVVSGNIEYTDGEVGTFESKPLPALMEIFKKEGWRETTTHEY